MQLIQGTYESWRSFHSPHEDLGPDCHRERAAHNQHGSSRLSLFPVGYCQMLQMHRLRKHKRASWYTIRDTVTVRYWKFVVYGHNVLVEKVQLKVATLLRILFVAIRDYFVGFTCC